MASLNYFIHFIRNFQEGNNDVLIINASDKGTGKSTLSLHMAREYIFKFGFICPYCKCEFYKNLYDKKPTDKGYVFFIPDEIKNNEVNITCPEIYELNRKTKKREKTSGCGKTFVWSERKRIRWDADKYIAYNNKDAYRKMLTSVRYAPLVFDEAYNFMAGDLHNRTESKELKRLFTVIRPRRLLMVANIPHIKWIDSKYREIMSHFWFQCLDRGLAVCYEKDKGISKDVWHLKEVEKHMGIVKYFSSLDSVRKKLKKTPTYFDTFTFPKLPDKIYDDYELVRNAHNLQQQIEEQDFSSADLSKVMCWQLLHNWERISSTVVKNKTNKMTYNVLRDTILLDPLTRKTLASDTTIRNWIRGVDAYLESKGEDTNWVETRKRM